MINYISMHKAFIKGDIRENGTLMYTLQWMGGTSVNRGPAAPSLV